MVFMRELIYIFSSRSFLLEGLGSPSFSRRTYNELSEGNHRLSRINRFVTSAHIYVGIQKVPQDTQKGVGKEINFKRL